MMDHHDLVDSRIVLVIDIITIISLLSFLRSFLSTKEKNYGLYMILILNISDLAYPITNLLTIFLSKNPQNLKIIGPMVVSIYSFFVVWSAAFAIYTYMLLKSIHQGSFFNYKCFMFLAITISLFFAILFPTSLTLGLWGEEVSFSVHGLYAVGYLPKGSPFQVKTFIIFNGLGYFLPIIITSYCYFRVYRILKVPSSEITYSKTATTRMFWYSLIPIICFAPGAFLEVWFTLRGEYLPFKASILVNGLHRCWGFMNLLAFWIFKPSDDDRTQSMLGREPRDTLQLINASHMEF